MGFYPSLLILCASILSTGCTVVAGTYGNSIDAQATLRSAKEKNANAVSVGKFKHSGVSDNYSTGCRGGEIRPQQTFSNYIRAALVDELRLAGLYEQTSPINVVADISKLDVSTGSDASWTIVVIFSIGEATHTSTVSHSFTSSIDGAAVCENAGQAFPTAVQKIVSQFFLSKEFNDAIFAGKDATKTEPKKTSPKQPPRSR